MSRLESAATRFAALGHPARLSILRMLVKSGPDGTNVGRIGATLGIPGSTLTHHLDKLAACGLIHCERSGTFILCRPAFRTLQELSNYLWQDCCREGGPNA